MTNEAEVVNARSKISELKLKYIDATVRFINAPKGDLEKEEYLGCIKAANEYFSYVETFVGDSELLGSHQGGKWITGFAEDCYEVLNSFLIHYELVTTHNIKVLGIEYPAIGPMVYANMQRMVAEYLKDKKNELQNKFNEKGLPIRGFTVKAMKKQDKEKMLLAVSIGLGVLLTAAVFVVSIYMPSPTKWQEFVFKAVLSMGLAGIGTGIPGFVVVSIQTKIAENFMKIYGAGALAIFLILLFKDL